MFCDSSTWVKTGQRKVSWVRKSEIKLGETSRSEESESKGDQGRGTYVVFLGSGAQTQGDQESGRKMPSRGGGCWGRGRLEGPASCCCYPWEPGHVALGQGPA